MTIKIGDKIPAVTLKTLTSDGMKDLATESFFAGKNMVLFAVPGAFTPTCTAKHFLRLTWAKTGFFELGFKFG